MMLDQRRPYLISLALLATSSISMAEVRLPALFGDHMVLQRDSTVAIWGWAEPGEKVSIELDWKDTAIEAVTDAAGSWKAKIPTGAAGDPHSITVIGTNRIEINDVLFGEVWVCSGQSNMEWTVDLCAPLYDPLKLKADHPRLRLFDVRNSFSTSPQADCVGKWAACTPENVGSFSAVAYFYGVELLEALDVPIGLISSNWGGTVCESWTSEATIEGLGEFDQQLAVVRGERELAADSEVKRKVHQNFPTALFNGMIAPLIPFGIRGAIWYQGESNRTRPEQYVELFPAMIADWRNLWGQGDFPFYYVQIAPFHYSGDPEHQAARLREAQRLTLRTPNTGMAVTMDIGNPSDIHPKNKLDVGKRLAFWALARTYERPMDTWSGPLFRQLEIERGELRLHFDQTGGGLQAEGPLSHFEIAGADGNWMAAEARIDDDTVVVSAVGCPDPQAARYGWGADDMPNLKNAEGLPASSFSTEDWPLENL